MSKDVKKILDLNPNNSISNEISDRQLEVITKAYEFLCKKENNVFYIADEVGLGKTYIAAGISLLFRHFSKDKKRHKDLIIVPKKNLQNKWIKDLANFQRSNYLVNNVEIEKQFNEDLVVKERIHPLENAITIFRMTSFSGVASKKKSPEALFSYLIDVIFKNDEFVYDILSSAWHMKYFYAINTRKLKRLVSYLLNIQSPKLNCVIIDEAHNYKYGLEGLNDDNLSIRNDTTAHFLGAIKNKEILEDFPELKNKIKFPLAENVICLSATPKDRSLTEIKNQLDCFTNKHILSNIKSNTKIKEKLNKFLVRGNLEYILNGETVSRNKCNHEHRKGNVEKLEKGEPLEIKDNFESVFWQLLQYKSIKHLHQKPNPSFEIGMLAGFETYNIDVSKRIKKELSNNEDFNEDFNEDETQQNGEKEYDHLKNKKNNRSQDLNIVSDIVNSYKEDFDDLPPHPKQSRLVNELNTQLKRQEKSLIFARRVATVYEIEKRLLDKYEKEIIINQQLKFVQKSKYKSDSVKKMLEMYDYREVIENLDDVLDVILRNKELKKALAYKNKLEVKIFLKNAFIIAKKRTKFKEEITEFVKKKKSNISADLKKATKVILKNFQSVELSKNTDVEKDEDDTIISDYFFSNFFKKKYGEEGGFGFKQKLYRSTWFSLNIVDFNNYFKIIEIPDYIIQSKKTDTSYKRLNDETEALFLNLKSSKTPFNFNSKNNLEDKSVLKTNTFITSLLIIQFNKEIKNWLQKRKNKSISEFILDFKILDTILLNVFRNGSGLLLSYIIDSTNEDFEKGMLEILKEKPFQYILDEIRTIINDFDLIVEQNFSNDNKNVNQVNRVFKSLTPIIGTTGQNKVDKSIIAAKFRMPGMPYILVTTDIFREGEDLHTYCQNVYHYGIAWNPSDMQQRTGRIDRINSMSYRKITKTQKLSFDNKIQVFYPYLSKSFEVNQVILLFENLNKFVETFNDIDKKNDYEDKVSFNEKYEEDNIPKQITKSLKSSYDIDKFLQ